MHFYIWQKMTFEVFQKVENTKKYYFKMSRMAMPEDWKPKVTGVIAKKINAKWESTKNKPKMTVKNFFSQNNLFEPKPTEEIYSENLARIQK